MGRVDIILPDDLETRFRKAVFKRFGMRKGNLTKAVQEAIRQWVEDEKK